MEIISDPIHTYHRVTREHTHFLLLLIPSIIFAVTIAILITSFSKNPKMEAAATTVPDVLGTQNKVK